MVYFSQQRDKGVNLKSSSTVLVKIQKFMNSGGDYEWL